MLEAGPEAEHIGVGRLRREPVEHAIGFGHSLLSRIEHWSIGARGVSLHLIAPSSQPHEPLAGTIALLQIGDLIRHALRGGDYQNSIASEQATRIRVAVLLVIHAIVPFRPVQ